VKFIYLLKSIMLLSTINIKIIFFFLEIADFEEYIIDSLK